MRSSPEKGEFLPAIIHYLKSVGVHVQHWNTSPSQEKAAVPASSRGVFGVPFHLLPVSEQAEGVPQFLVDACELLRPHLHVEGLFRKCGSMTRIRALKTRLEAGENCLEMALPCDLATLVKQFLRDLPEPLIPIELQRPLCEVQQREDRDLRGPLTVLLTCLLPPGSAPTLRYFFTFLQEVSSRCAQNKMDLANLAVVFAPNLFSSELCSKLDSRAEEQLQRQAAVIQALISHASKIGTVPQPLLEKVQAAFSDIESQKLSPSGSEDARHRGAKARKRRSQRRRRSVSDIVTETLSKLKMGRTLCTTPCEETKEDFPSNVSLKVSFNSKRKASDDVTCWVSELSAKKRRSILDSASSDSLEDAGDPFDEPTSAVFSSSPSNPVSNAQSRASSPRVPAVTVQRKRNSCRNQPQSSTNRSGSRLASSGGSAGEHRHGMDVARKRSFQATPACSPAPLQRKDTGRKSLCIFFRSSKYPVSPLEQPHPDSDKAAEPGGCLLMKKTVMESLDGPTSQQRWAQLPSYKLKESEKGSPNPPSSEDPYYAPPCKDLEVLDTIGNGQQGAGLSPGLDGICGLQQEADLDVQPGSQRLLDKTEGLVAEDRLPAPPLRRHRVLRRSLSWPEDLSVAAEQKEMASSPDEALISPGGPERQMYSLAEPAPPGVEEIVAGMRQLGIPALCVTRAGDDRVGCPVNRPSPLPSRLEPPEGRVTLANRLRHLNEVPKNSLKRLALTFQRASSQANEGLNAPPKRKGGRRFGRSVSHESNLPLQAQQEEKQQTGSAAKRGATTGLPTKSPLQSFRACGQQIILTRKHIAMSFAGLRRKKEVLPPSPQNPALPAAVSQEPVLERRNLCPAKSPFAEMPFSAHHDSLNL